MQIEASLRRQTWEQARLALDVAYLKAILDKDYTARLRIGAAILDFDRATQGRFAPKDAVQDTSCDDGVYQAKHSS